MISFLHRSVLLVALVFSSFSFIEKKDSALAQSQDKLAQLELEIKTAKSQIDNLDKTNDKILQVTYFTVGSMFALIAGLAIWNAVAGYRINTNKMQEAISKIRIEQQESVKKYLDSAVPSRIDSKFNGVDSKYKELEISILRIQIELKKMQVISTDLSPGANMETWTLVELLNLTYKNYKTEFAASDYDVKQALQTLITYTSKYHDLPDSEVDMVLTALKKVEEENFVRYISEVRKNLVGTK